MEPFMANVLISSMRTNSESFELGAAAEAEIVATEVGSLVRTAPIMGTRRRV